MFETKGQKWFECHGWDNDVPKIFYAHKKRYFNTWQRAILPKQWNWQNRIINV